MLCASIAVGSPIPPYPTTLAVNMGDREHCAELTTNISIIRSVSSVYFLEPIKPVLYIALKTTRTLISAYLPPFNYYNKFSAPTL